MEKADNQSKDSSTNIRKPYKIVNGCTHRLAPQQLLIILVFLLMLIIHLLLILPSILTVEWASSIILLILFMSTLCLYLFLTLFDPVDKRVKDPEYKPTLTDKPYSQKFCQYCQHHVDLTSKHCSVCDRCCQDFDHHCNFVNNCIGGHNYKQFLALVLICLLFLVVYIYQGLTVFTKYEQLTKTYEVFSTVNWKYAIIVAVFLAAILFLLQIILISMHLYLRCLLYSSTYEWIKKNKYSDGTATLDMADKKPIETFRPTAAIIL